MATKKKAATPAKKKPNPSAIATTTIAFRVDRKTKESVDKKYPGFEGRKKVVAKLKAYYATLLRK